MIKRETAGNLTANQFHNSMHITISHQKFLTCISIATSTFLLASCASGSRDIPSASISPLQYQNFTCNQLIDEGKRLQSKAFELAGHIDKAAENDKTTAGLSILFFPPAAFALGGNKAQEAEYSRVKGEHEAVQRNLSARNCSLSPTQSAINNSTNDASNTSRSPTLPQNKGDQNRESPTGRTFVVSDSDPTSGAVGSNQRWTLTYMDERTIEYNSGDYISDVNGNTISGRSTILIEGLFKRDATLGQSWNATIKSADKGASAKVKVSLLGTHDIQFTNGNLYPVVKLALEGWASAPLGTGSQLLMNEKFSGTISMDPATGFPLEYTFKTRTKPLSMTRRLVRVQ